MSGALLERTDCGAMGIFTNDLHLAFSKTQTVRSVVAAGKGDYLANTTARILVVEDFQSPPFFNRRDTG